MKITDHNLFFFECADCLKMLLSKPKFKEFIACMLHVALITALNPRPIYSAFSWINAFGILSHLQQGLKLVDRLRWLMTSANTLSNSSNKCSMGDRFVDNAGHKRMAMLFCHKCCVHTFATWNLSWGC